MRDTLPEGTPSHDFWLHLGSGLEQARDELAQLEPHEQLLLEVIAEYVFQARSRLRVSSDSTTIVTNLVPVLDHPWVKFSIDLRLAEDLVDRGVGGFDRYKAIVAVLARSKLPEITDEYIREAALTYVYGFYASCTVFCAAALERILRTLLLARGREVSDRATAGEMLRDARELPTLRGVLGDAESLVSMRNDVIHGRLPGREDLSRHALASLRALTKVLAESHDPVDGQAYQPS